MHDPPTLGEFGRRASALLSELIRIKTVNPPGNERGLQEVLKRILEDSGFECVLVGEAARPNLIARLEGTKPGPTLCYLGHVDTVLADPTEWSVDPWAGSVLDGQVWGRGALDMKGQVACEVVAACALAEGGRRPRTGELKLVFTCDEETGGTLGARRLCEEHPDLVRADYIVNEGGGSQLRLGNRRIYVLCVGEKGAVRVKVETKGRPGHASMPGLSENALVKMAPLLERLRERRPEPIGSPVTEALVSTVLGEGVSGDLAQALDRIRTTDPRLSALLDPATSLTLVPTMIEAGEKVNVVPSRCTLRIDSRVPPGCDERDVLSELRSLFGDAEYRVEITGAIAGNESAFKTPLTDAIAEFVAANDPGAEIAPVVQPFFTDSNWFRAAFGSVAYGFCPIKTADFFDTMALVHGADERVAVEDLAYAASFFHWLPGRLLDGWV